MSPKKNLRGGVGGCGVKISFDWPEPDRPSPSLCFLCQLVGVQTRPTQCVRPGVSGRELSSQRKLEENALERSTSWSWSCSTTPTTPTTTTTPQGIPVCTNIYVPLLCRVAKCQIFYTDNNLSSKFYPKKRVIRNWYIFATKRINPGKSKSL